MPITSGSYSRIHASSAVVLFIMLLAFIYKHINLFFLITFGLLNVSDFHSLFCTVCFIQELFTLQTFNESANCPFVLGLFCLAVYVNLLPHY